MTYGGATVGVVVPAYNEASFVGDVVFDLPTFVDRVYLVDDRSEDGTWTVVCEAAARVNRAHAPTDPFDRVVVPLRHGRNRGAGAATLTGYRRALDDGVDVVATLDGDGQMDPAFLPSLLDPVVEGRVAYAKGDRLDGIDHVREMSPWRLFGNTLLTALTRAASGYWRHRDPQNGFTVVSRDALATLELDRLYERYGFRNDVLVHLNVAGFRIADVSHPANYGAESSHIRYPSFVPGLSWLLARRFCWRLERQCRREGTAVAAAVVGGVVGLLVSVAGLATGTGTGSEGDVDAGWPDGGRRDEGAAAGLAPVAATLLLIVGLALDVRRQRGRVVRVDGRPSTDHERFGGGDATS